MLSRHENRFIGLGGGSCAGIRCPTLKSFNGERMILWGHALHPSHHSPSLSLESENDENLREDPKYCWFFLAFSILYKEYHSVLKRCDASLALGINSGFHLTKEMLIPKVLLLLFFLEGGGAFSILYKEYCSVLQRCDASLVLGKDSGFHLTKEMLMPKVLLLFLLLWHFQSYTKNIAQYYKDVVFY